MAFPRFSAAAIFVALAASVASGQEAEIEPADEAVGVALNFGEDPEQALTAAVEKELKVASKLARINDTQITKIMSALKGTIRKRAESGGNVGMQATITGALDDRMLGAVLQAVKAEATDKTRFTEYEQDVTLRRNFKRTAVVSSFIQSLESRVGLGADQIDAARKVVVKLYESGKLPEGVVYGMISSDDQPMKIDALMGVLTQSQQKYYKKFAEWQPFGDIEIDEEGKPVPSDEKADREELLGQLRMVAEMKLESLDRALTLTDKQKKKLRLVSKGVLASAADEKMAAKKAFEEYQERMMAGAGAAMEGSDMEVMNKAMAHPVEIFVAQPRWSRFVRATLTEAQKKRMAELEAMRQQRATQVLCSTLVLSIGTELQLCGKQQFAMSKVLAKRVKAPPEMTSLATTNPVGMYRGLLAVKDKEWIQAIGEDNLAKLKPLLAPLRQMIEQMESKSKE